MAALIFCDGFDKYGPIANSDGSFVPSLVGDWSQNTYTPAVAAPLSDFGYAIGIGNGTLFGSLAASVSRVAGCIRFMLPTTVPHGFVAFYGGTTAAFSFSINSIPSPGIIFSSNNVTLASGGAVNNLSVHVLSWDITIGASAAYAVYLDGELLFSGTGNTGNGLTTVNSISIGAGIGSQITFDDLVVFNATDPNYDAGFLTKNVIVETTYPNDDVQTQLANDGNVLWATGVAENGVYTSGGVSSGPSSSLTGLGLIKVTPRVNCNLNSISGLPSDTFATLKLTGVVYSDAAGNPGSLLRSGTEVIGITDETVFTLPITPLPVVAGTPIWIGLFSDATGSGISLHTYDIRSDLARRYTNTYASGAPAGPLGVGTTAETFTFWGNCTGAAKNFTIGLNPPFNGDASKLHGDTAGQTDLYHFAPLRSNPSTIYGVAVKGFVSKSDTGPRTVSLPTRSGATTSNGSLPAQALATSNQWQRSMYDKNPNGNVAWTKATVDAASSGVGVAT